MKEDTRDALKRFEEELLAESLQEELESGPAFEDPDEIFDLQEDEMFQNFANDYGRIQENPPPKRMDGEMIALLVTVCVLCLAIIGVLVYWLEVYL